MNSYAYAQSSDLLIGDWYFTKATAPNGTAIKESPNFYRFTITGKNWGTVYFSVENDVRNIQYLLKENTITFHYTNSNLDPTFTLSIVDVDNLILKNEFGTYSFKRIIQSVHEDKQTVYQFRESEPIQRSTNFKMTEFKGDLAKFILDKTYALGLNLPEPTKVSFVVSKSGTIENITIINANLDSATHATLSNLIILTDKRWFPASRGREKADQKVAFTIPNFEQNAEPLDNTFKYQDFLQNQWIQGKSLQDKEDDLTALDKFNSVEVGFDFLMDCAMYSKTVVSGSAYEAYLNAMCNKGIVLLNLKRDEEACATFKKIRGNSVQAGDFFNKFCGQ